MIDKYYAGLGCQCMARHQGDCACDNVDWTPREVYELRKRIAELERRILELGVDVIARDLLIKELNNSIVELKEELTKSTDQNDLVLDEFIRVKCLTDNTEIHQLCERAHVRMRQRVSVIDRNHKLEVKVKELDSELKFKNDYINELLAKGGDL